MAKSRLERKGFISEDPTDLPAGVLMAFSHLRFLFPDNVSLCQADKKQKQKT